MHNPSDEESTSSLDESLHRNSQHDLSLTDGRDLSPKDNNNNSNSSIVHGKPSLSQRIPFLRRVRSSETYRVDDTVQHKSIDGNSALPPRNNDNNLNHRRKRNNSSAVKSRFYHNDYDKLSKKRQYRSSTNNNMRRVASSCDAPHSMYCDDDEDERYDGFNYEYQIRTGEGNHKKRDHYHKGNTRRKKSQWRSLDLFLMFVAVLSFVIFNSKFRRFMNSVGGVIDRQMRRRSIKKTKVKLSLSKEKVHNLRYKVEDMLLQNAHKMTVGFEDRYVPRQIFWALRKRQSETYEKKLFWTHWANSDNFEYNVSLRNKMLLRKGGDAIHSTDEIGDHNSVVPRNHLEEDRSHGAFEKVLAFNDEQMGVFVHNHCPALYPLFLSDHRRDLQGRYSLWDERVAVWSLCTLYTYGGVFVGEAVSDITTPLHEIVKFEANSENGTPNNNFRDKDLMLIVLKENNSVDLDLWSSTPHHSVLKVVMDSLIETYNLSREEPLLHPRQSLRIQISNLLVKTLISPIDSAVKTEAATIFKNNTVHTFLREECTKCKVATECCNVVRLDQNSTKVTLAKIERPDTSLISQPISFNVTINELGSPPEMKWTPKHSVSLELSERRCGNWFCDRCLNYSKLGSLSNCSKFCGKCYEKSICKEESSRKGKDVLVEVQVSATTVNVDNGNNYSPSGLIPKVIHQTWFEELTQEAYPDLSRLRNSWIASGWEYRFYDDDTARAYIESNFPSRFLVAYDSLIPGAFKADFFRLLVLLKDGGIYADIDVMLETSLDSFISPDLSFFAPLDSPGEEEDSRFCLWNGLMGSSPGHPFVLRAVEKIVNFILNKFDINDIIRDTCQVTGSSMEIWKIRTAQPLIICGPCAVGMAINEALGRNSLSKFQTGLHHEEAKFAVATGSNELAFKILNIAKNDLGAHRISDPETNTIVATTDIPYVSITRSKVRRQYEFNDEENVIQPKHYSNTASEDHVFGSRLVYKDSLVLNERVSFSYKVSDASKPI